MNPSPRVALAIRVGVYYSNGGYGRAWGVRQVLGCARDAEKGGETVSYKGIAGACRRKAGDCTLDEFRKWARYEVALNENSWHRVGPPDPDEAEP